MSEWNKLTLKDAVLKANTGADAITRAPIVNHDSGIRCIRIQDISNEHVFDRWGFCDVSEVNYKKFSLKKGDILIARTGNTIGVNRYIFSDLPSVFNNGLIRLKTNKEICLSKYIYYLFQTQNFKGHINSIAYGTSTQPNMQIESLLRFTFDCPPIQTQEKIVAIFSILDRKISNLRKQNETLEAIAQTLFKHWFVDFEFPNEDGKPHKSSGGEMVRSELGEIPVGWLVGTLGDVTVTITKGTTPTTFKKQFQDSGINFVKAESITDDRSMDSSRFAYIDEETNQLFKRSILQAKDLVYTIAGTIGRYAMVNESILPANTNQAVAIIRPDIEKVDPEYLLCYFSSKSYQHYLSSRVVQAVQANLSLGILSESPIVLPDKNIKMKFGRLAKAIFQKKEENQKQIQTLTKTRDVLLPKLMSGKLRITAS